MLATRSAVVTVIALLALAFIVATSPTVQAAPIDKEKEEAALRALVASFAKASDARDWNALYDLFDCVSAFAFAQLFVADANEFEAHANVREFFTTALAEAQSEKRLGLFDKKIGDVFEIDSIELRGPLGVVAGTVGTEVLRFVCVRGDAAWTIMQVGFTLPIEADLDNLKGLMKIFVAGMADQRRMPLTSGWQFWSSLYIENADSGADRFADASDVGFLISPRDPMADAEAALEVAREVYESGDVTKLVYENGHCICSYMGPKIAVLRAMSTLSGKIIGAGVGRGEDWYYPGGIPVLYGNIGTEFLTWKDVRRIANNDTITDHKTFLAFLKSPAVERTPFVGLDPDTLPE